MIRALYTAASGMSAQQSNLDTIANNLANSGTTGFRARQMEFEDMIYQNLVTPGAAQSASTASSGLQIGLGTKSVASEVIMTQGDFTQTGNMLDLAIQGSGFFPISMPDGTPLVPNITIPSNATAVTISQYGVVSATLPGQPVGAQIGTIQLATFANPGGLTALGSNLFQPTFASGNAITDVPGGTSGMGTLQQGSTENSNVDVVAAFVQMIVAQRAYESNSKVVHVADDMYSQINGLVR